MQLIIHPGTGTIIDAADNLYLLDTTTLNKEDTTRITEGDDADILDIAATKGNHLTPDVLAINYSNSLSFTPELLKEAYGSRTHDDMGETTGYETHIGEWLKDEATTQDFYDIAENILYNHDLWTAFNKAIRDSINKQHQRRTQ
jgi:hypothetical protein